MRRIGATVLSLVFLLSWVAIPVVAQSQGWGPGMMRGYGDGPGRTGGGYGPQGGGSNGGYGGRGGYGPSGDYGPSRGYGPHGGGYGRGGSDRGPGMMRGYGGGQRGVIGYTEAMRSLRRVAGEARIDRKANRIVFRSARVYLSVAAVQPGFPDTTFEVGGLVDPTIVVPRGARVTLSLVNMDYGAGMDHGLLLTSVPPPYPVFTMMGMRGTIAALPVLRPRSTKRLERSRYTADTITFTAPPPGTYYYLCQYYDHASRGMYGTLIVSGR